MRCRSITVVRPIRPQCRSRGVFIRAAWKILGALLLGSTLFAAGAERAGQQPAQLTLNWVDNAAGTANFIVERKTGTAGTFARIATTAPGVTTYVDSTVVA